MECEGVSRHKRRRHAILWDLTKETHLLPVPSLPSWTEPENSMVGVSPEIVLERLTKHFPSSCSLTKTPNVVDVRGVRHGKLAMRLKTKAGSKRESARCPCDTLWRVSVVRYKGKFREA